MNLTEKYLNDAILNVNKLADWLVTMNNLEAAYYARKSVVKIKIALSKGIRVLSSGSLQDNYNSEGAELSMNLKQLLESELGKIDDVIFGKAYAAYIRKFDELPDAGISLERLDWITDYIMKEMDNHAAGKID